MAHDIFESRFVAVRVPAWHRLGTVVDEPLLPSRAVERFGLDLGGTVEPLFVLRDGRPVDVGLAAVGRWEPEGFQLYGTGKQFELVPLDRVLPALDEFAATHPLTSAGTLARGGEVFFCCGGAATEIAGEEYQEYFVYRHSYTPGRANLLAYSPVRVVCRNTLVAAEAEATFRLAVAHTAGAGDRTVAGLMIAQAYAARDAIATRLEAFAQTRVADVQEVLEQVYAPYRPSTRIDLDRVADTAPADLVELVVRPDEAQARYADRLVETATAAYARLCDEYPAVAGTAYAVYQAVVEVADHRRGRATAMESAVAGTRANEKVRAWRLLSSLA